MMVTFDFAVKPACNARKVNAANDAPLQQRIQSPVNGGPRKSRKPLMHGLEDLFRRGMVVPPQNGFENHSALHGDRNALPAAKLFEFQQFLFDFS